MLDVALKLKKKKKKEGGVVLCGFSLIMVRFREMVWLR